MAVKIYKITNVLNGKSYIGLTKQTTERRWYQHCWYATHRRYHSKFMSAIRKYGTSCWKIEILIEVTDDEAKATEQIYIKEYNTYEAGYNSTQGGEDFSSSEYQRRLQNDRVRNGTHPFLGGEIQKATGIRRHKEGSLIEFNAARIKRNQDGTASTTSKAYQARRKAAGIPHHNQVCPWLNTRANPQIWRRAAELHEWYQLNRHKRRGSSYKAMGIAFGIKPSEVVSILKYFRKGWTPMQDDAWIKFVALA